MCYGSIVMFFSANGKIHTDTLIVLVVGIIASTFIFSLVREHDNDQVDAVFTTIASDKANIIVEGFSHVFFSIESVAALFYSSSDISLNQFNAFVSPLLKRFPTISALGWVPKITDSKREEFEHTAQKLFPGFEITERSVKKGMVEATERQMYFPVYYIHPIIGNQAALGFDLYSNEVRRAAIDQAYNTGRSISTARLNLVQEHGNLYSLLIIHPVFKSGVSTKEKDNLLGVASAVFRIGYGLEQALSHIAPARMNIWLYDRSAEPDKQFLYYHPSSKQKQSEGETTPTPLTSGRHFVHRFDLGGRIFELIIVPAQGYFNTSSNYLAWLSLLIVLGFTGLLVAYLELRWRRERDLAIGQEVLEQQVKERINTELLLREANITLETLSRKDPLMGIGNRRHFDEYMQQEWRRAVRNGKSISLLIGDVDFFKDYNDTYGHIAGDKCLKQLAQALLNTVDRQGDLIARYGGEEIAVVLPTTTAFGAHRIAEKIRSSIESLALPHKQSTLGGVVTMSIGCGTSSPTQNSSVETFINAVDAALYQAKHQGRNQTVVANFDGV